MGYLSSINSWGQNKARDKQLALIRQATSKQSFDHPMFKMHVGWVAVLVGLFIFYWILSFGGFGGIVLDLMQPSAVSTEHTALILLLPYAFYLAWMIPSILLAGLLLQLTFALIPRIGNTYTAHDIAKAIALDDGNKDAEMSFNNYTVSLDEVRELVEHVDLNKIRWHGVRGMSKGFLVVFLVLSPLMYLSANTYFAKTADNILLYSSFLSLGSEEIAIEDIDDVDVEASWNQDTIEPVYELNLIDGRSIDLWDIGFAASDMSELIEIASYLDSQGVFHFRMPLPDLSPLRPAIQAEFEALYDAI